jgi:hypothetical protein
MGYKILGYVVWQGVKLYVRQNAPNARRNVAIAGATAAIVGTAVIAARQQSHSE